MNVCVVYDPQCAELPEIPVGLAQSGVVWIAIREGYEELVVACAPGFALLDLRRHGPRIATPIRRMREALPQTRILVLGPASDLAAAEAALRAGADGYVTRPESLARALRSLGPERLFVTGTGRDALARRDDWRTPP